MPPSILTSYLLKKSLLVPPFYIDFFCGDFYRYQLCYLLAFVSLDKSPNSFILSSRNMPPRWPLNLLSCSSVYSSHGLGKWIFPEWQIKSLMLISKAANGGLSPYLRGCEHWLIAIKDRYRNLALTMFYRRVSLQW